MNSIMVISQFTFKEIYRSKILLNVFLIGLLISISSVISSELSYGNSSKITIDVGLGLMSIANTGLAIFLGVGLLSKELNDGSAFFFLTSPISRFDYLSGKILGLVGFLLINHLFLSLVTLFPFILSGGNITFLLIQALGLIFLEGLVMLSIVLPISLMTNNYLAVLGALSFYIAGHFLPGLESIHFLQNDSFTKVVYKFLKFITPNLTLLNLKDYILYESHPRTGQFWIACIYGIFYSGSFFFLGHFYFKRKDIF